MTVALWGSAFAAIRRALHGYGAAELSLLRLAVASLALVVVAPVRGLDRPRAGDLRLLLAAGGAGMTAYQLLLNGGEVAVPAGAANVIGSLSLVLTALAAVVVFGERLTPVGWLGTAVAWLGAALVALGISGGWRLEPRALLVLGAAAAQAGFFLLQKPLLRRYSSFTVTARATWLGTALLLPLAPRLPDAVAHADPGSTAAALYLGLGPSVVGFLTWGYAVARVDVSFATSTLFLAPVVAFLSGWALLGEVPTPATVLGGLVAVAGVAVTTVARRRTGLTTSPSDATASAALAER